MKIKVESIFALLSFLMIISFAWFAGSSEVGPDYKNYTDMIYRISLSDGLINSMVAAKDPLFGAIVYYIDPANKQQYSYVFIFVAYIVAIHRLVLIRRLGKWFLAYFFVYILLYSPAYDFSAIRSLLGLSFLVLGIFSRRRLYALFFYSLSILSHISMILPVFLISKKIDSLSNKLTLRVVIPSLFLSGFALSSIIYLFPQTQEYIGMRGSWLLFFRALGNSLSIFIIYQIVKGIVDEDINRMLKCSLYISIIAVSCISVSIATTRLMDIANYIILIVVFMLPWRRVLNKQNFVMMIFCFSFLLVNSIYRMYSSNLFYVLYSR
ncbi:EpsG family protein [Vibrio campbellii]|uniref:EpsG family protein n=1 Tax=Vibrio campbellii TaxID=680 RepID=UPI004055CE1B